ncbi:MAG: hypothetical protein QF570_01070, partial [Myxococcota bacterium]|nr:hypothetical protein [Myxococcota bacterium]
MRQVRTARPMSDVSKLLGIAALLPLVPLAVGVSLYFGHVNDDAFITYRYSQALATGQGPYFNPGEAVEGYTNFLLMLILSGVHVIAGAAALPWVSKVIGIGGMGVAVAALPRIGVRVAPGNASVQGLWVGAVAGCLVAVFPGVTVNATSGLETGLYAGLTVAALICARDAGLLRCRFATTSGCFWAAAVITRPEGALIFAVWWVARVASGLRGWRAIADAVPVVTAFIGLTLFRYFVYDGELLPNTWYAKGGGYLGLTPGVYVVNGAMAPFLGPIGVAFSLVGYGVGFSRGRALGIGYGRTLVPIAAVGLVGAALPFITGSDWMPGWRFSVPYLPALAIVIVVGWMALLRSFLGDRLATAALLVVVLVAAIAHHPERVELKERLDLRAKGYVSGHGALAEWLGEEALHAGDTVALMDIGIVGYRNPDVRIL